MKVIKYAFICLLACISLQSCTELDEDTSELETTIVATGGDEDDPVKPGGGN